MKTLSILLTLSLFLTSNAQTTKKALFLGNSYTYYNGGLPQLIENLATANGDILIHDQNTPGGYRLDDHATNATTLNKISSANWDYVVLQAQSQEPSFSPGQVAAQTKPYAVILNDYIKSNNSCSKTMFFMTWGRENGDASNCANYAPLCTYEGMQGRLRESYLEMTVENNADCAPVGVAWKKVREDFPAINLYSPDESHPSIYGSYLAACVFYSSMYHKTSVGNTYWSTLDSLTAYRLQDIASSTVLDSLSTWSIETVATSFDVIDSSIAFCDSVEVLGNWFSTNTQFADTINIVGSCAEITNYNLSIGGEIIDSVVNFCDSVEILGNWFYVDTNFIDTTIGAPCDLYVNYELVISQPLILDYWRNNTETVSAFTFDYSFVLKNADSVYIYIDSSIFSANYSSNLIDTFSVFKECDDDQEHSLTIVSKNNCASDSLTINVACQIASSLKEINNTDFKISPNPANNFIEIKTGFTEDFAVKLIDISGKVLTTTQQSNHQFTRLDVSTFDKGIYFLIVYNKSGIAIGQKKLIIN